MTLPNQLTILRIILTPVFLVLFLSEEPMLKQISVAVFLIAAATDWFDGKIARRYDKVTELGKFLDPIADKVLTLTAFFAFVFLDVLELWMVLIVVLRDVIVTGLRVIADRRNIAFTTSRSAKWKTFFQMSFLYYLLLVYTLITIETIYLGNENLFSYLVNNTAIYYTMLVISLFTFYTGIEYLYQNRHLIKGLFSEKT